jgi:hypothetical protein
MGTRSLIAIVVILGGCVALAATNPTKFDYGNFLESELQRALDQVDATRSADARLIRQLLRSQGPGVIQAVVKHNTLRHNYGLFSLFETHILGERLSILGVGRRFVPLTDREHLSRLLGRIKLSKVFPRDTESHPVDNFNQTGSSMASDAVRAASPGYS